MDIVGYLGAWSYRPGDTLTAFLGARPDPAGATRRVEIDVVELGVGNERADADGIVFEPLGMPAPQPLALTWQPTDAGSYARIDGIGRATDLPAEGCLVLACQPWALQAPTEVAMARAATLLATGRNARAWSVGLDGLWQPVLSLGEAQVTVRRSLALRQWSMLVLDWSRTEARLRLRLVDQRGSVAGEAQLCWPAGMPLFEEDEPLLLAGQHDAAGQVGRHFNGRLERPAILCSPSGGQASIEIGALWSWLHGTAAQAPAEVWAEWDFSIGISAQRIEDQGPRALHGLLVNLPKRAVRGLRWAGDCLDWRQCPQQYGAIHFHEDDLDNARWSGSAAMTLPDQLRSGAYALRVRDAEAAGRQMLLLPFFVRAPRPATQARLALVFPTYTYLAYANDHTLLHGGNAEVLAARAIALEPVDLALAAHSEWGLSLYDTHADGSGVTIASRLRPTLTFAPDQRAWQAGEGSGRWNYPADLLLVEWLNREGIPWEAITDEDIDREGVALLDSYDVLLTGNHPEYATDAMVRAWRDTIEHGRRVLYLGGNGFYWKVASSPAHPGVIELRRAEDGNRSWAEEPAEYYHQFDGGYGGLWRRNGVAPQSWLGIGYSGQGFRRSVGYSRNDDSDLPEVAFLFHGVPGRTFGEQGVIGGGCAGIEVDRADPLLGSPVDGYLLASSERFDDTYFMANEELLVTRPTIAGSYAASVRADLHLLVNPRGGAVFATGSIAWIGGLATAGGDAAVKQICRNVIMRFLDPAPLPPRRRAPDPSDA